VSLLSGWDKVSFGQDFVYMPGSLLSISLGDLQARVLLEPGKWTRFRAAAYYPVATQTKPATPEECLDPSGFAHVNAKEQNQTKV